MKTDYQNLNPIESLAVIFAALGFLLIGAIGFTALPEKNQVHVAAALQVFDMHEQLSRQQEGFVFLAFDLPQAFLSEFNTAFNEVAVIPYETILSWQSAYQRTQVAYGTVLDFSEKLAANYQENFVAVPPAGIVFSSAGQVAGASIARELKPETQTALLLENIVPAQVTNPQISKDPRGRGYEPPELKKIFEKILTLMEE